MTSYRTVNSVVRALGLLEILNRQKFTSIELLHSVSGLPKPTIVRFMETLSTAGYVTKDAAGKGYRITSAVTALSCGYQGAPLVVEAGRPWAQELTLKFKWPVALATLDENAMLVSYTTSADSPMSPYQGILHRRMGLLSKALGRAYLAFCPGDERRLILDMLESKPHPDSDRRMSRDEIDAMLAETRGRGFALRVNNSGPTPSSSLAVPIFEHEQDRVLGTLCMTYYTSAISYQQAAGRYLPTLRSAAIAVSESVASFRRQSGGSQREIDLLESA